MTYAMRHKRTAVVRRRGMGDAGIIDDFWDFVDKVASGTSEAPPTDNVNQSTGGGTSTSASDFTSVGGVCKPANFPALNAARSLQRQLNRVAQAKGFSKITSDGTIGPATLALFKKVQSISAGAVMGDPTTCMGVAPDVDVLSGQVGALADTLGAPLVVADPVLSVNIPTITTKSGKTVVSPDAGLLGSLAGMSSVEKIALVAVAGSIGYMLVRSKTKKRRK